jgi:alkanesulfonate monooxygenase SsuD/methylene tetrahydromethanopterin reductase-like flavin-dependent oxidoreductase (luciferase family)
MKAGVVYPQIELGGDTGAVKAFAQAAEDLGYDHIVIYDHVLGAVVSGASVPSRSALDGSGWFGGPAPGQ